MMSNYWFRNEKEQTDKKDKRTICCLYGFTTAIITFVIVLLCFVFGGCKSVKYVPVVTVHTDTCFITKQQRDSIHILDSIFVSEKQNGDTIFVNVTKWLTKYIERTSHDTTYISKRDTIPAPYPVEVKVEKELSKWQRFRMTIGGIALAMFAYWFVKTCYNFYRRRY